MNTFPTQSGGGAFPGTFEEYVAGLPDGISSANHRGLYQIAQRNASTIGLLETRQSDLEAALDLLASCGLSAGALLAFERRQKGDTSLPNQPDYVMPPAHRTGDDARRRAVRDYVPDPDAAQYDGPLDDRDGQPLEGALWKWNDLQKRKAREAEAREREAALLAPAPINEAQAEEEADQDAASDEREGDERAAHKGAFKRYHEALFDVAHFASLYLDDGREMDLLCEFADILSLRRAFALAPEAYEAIKGLFENRLEFVARDWEKSVRVCRGALAEFAAVDLDEE